MNEYTKQEATESSAFPNIEIGKNDEIENV